MIVSILLSNKLDLNYIETTIQGRILKDCEYVSESGDQDVFRNVGFRSDIDITKLQNTEMYCYLVPSQRNSYKLTEYDIPVFYCEEIDCDIIPVGKQHQ